MQSLCASTGSKWITTSPLYPGDLFNNLGCYTPIPDYTQDYWRMAHTAAEKFAYGSANVKYPYPEKAMFFYSASSGRCLVPEIMVDPYRIIEHARRFTDDKDAPYLTTRRAIDVLDSLKMKNVLAQNYRNNENASALAAQHLTDTYIVGPAHREQMLRSIVSKHSILQGISFEDAIFEKHLWGPFVLLVATKGIYGGDHAWSFNAPIEKATGLAVQYGSVVPVVARLGRGFDTIDVFNRPVPIVDQAWEDARALVDIAGTEVKLHNGSKVRFRFETAAALLVSRFMHDHMYQTGDTNLQRENAHKIVKEHYSDPAEQERFALLKRTIQPYLATVCNWPTLHNILDKDPALKTYWREQIEPSRQKFTSEAETQRTIMRYLPRGGYDNEGLNEVVEERRDKPRHTAFALAGLPQLSHGQHIDPFSRYYDPKMFNDRNFARLGGTVSYKDEPSSDHYVRGQAAAYMTIAELQHDGVPPKKTSRTLVYVDDPAGGVRTAAFGQRNNIDQQGEQGAIFDPLEDGGHTFAEEIAAENRADAEDRVRSLALDRDYAKWREEHEVGNIIPTSIVRQSLDMYTGYREGTKTMFHWALAAHGPLRLGGDVEETIVRRYIGLEANGLVIPSAQPSDRTCRYIVDGVLAATGMTPRTYEGGRYQFEFFMDRDDHAAPPRGVPQKLDLADLIIHLGLKTKQDLDARQPPKNRDRYVSLARLLHVYEMLIDPVNRNTVTERDERSGQDKQYNLINWRQVDPSFIGFALYQPATQTFALSDIRTRGATPDYDAYIAKKDYQDFRNDRLDIAAWTQDPKLKAQLAHMIWFNMRVDRVAPDLNLPVIGKLLVKGMHAFDHDDTEGLPEDYKMARHWRHNLSAKDRANIFKQRTLHVHGPTTAQP